MVKYIITEKDLSENNIDYIAYSLRDLFMQTSSVTCKRREGGRIVMDIETPEYFGEVVKAELFDKIAEVITINYKYEYFKKHISPHGLSAIEKELLLTSLISADFDEDKRYAVSKLKGFYEISMDGMYNFRLKLLKKKWEEIIGYMPEYFVNAQLKDFITYLLEGKKKKVYVENDKVYDADFRRLTRGNLMDENLQEGKVIREILLNGTGEVELAGQISGLDEFYLKEYYGEKVNFTKGLFS